MIQGRKGVEWRTFSNVHHDWDKQSRGNPTATANERRGIDKRNPPMSSLYAVRWRTAMHSSLQVQHAKHEKHKCWHFWDFYKKKWHFIKSFNFFFFLFFHQLNCCNMHWLVDMIWMPHLYRLLSDYFWTSLESIEQKLKETDTIQWYQGKCALKEDINHIDPDNPESFEYKVRAGINKKSYVSAKDGSLEPEPWYLPYIYGICVQWFWYFRPKRVCVNYAMWPSVLMAVNHFNFYSHIGIFTTVWKVLQLTAHQPWSV